MAIPDQMAADGNFQAGTPAIPVFDTLHHVEFLHLSPRALFQKHMHILYYDT